jgi:hypothetical protein
MCLKQKAFAAGFAAAFTMSLLASPALAKKVTYAQAWRLCKAEMDKDRIYSNWVSNDRFLRGGACMHKYGYRL